MSGSGTQKGDNESAGFTDSHTQNYCVATNTPHQLQTPILGARLPLFFPPPPLPKEIAPKDERPQYGRVYGDGCKRLITQNYPKTA